MEHIEMVDLKNQYLRIKPQIDAAIFDVLNSSVFIQGRNVADFERELEQYTGSRNVVTCANGTDALIAALLALDVRPGDEVITVPFTFISAVEAIMLVGAKPVFVDVTADTFSMNPDCLEQVISEKTKAIIPVHLFGQCAEMEKICAIAKKYNIKSVEDACQAIGTTYTFSDGTDKQAGTIGDVGCVSFFPSKNLGCFGDGGAIFTDNDDVAEKLRLICKHGSKVKYHNEIVGFNSRLDAIQAAVLRVKLNYLGEYIIKRQAAATFYSEHLCGLDWLQTPARSHNSTHTFHQYTIKIKDNQRNNFSKYLTDNGIPNAIYYPVPAHLQKAYNNLGYKKGDFPVSEALSEEVISLPMHTEITEAQLQYICKTIVNFKHL